MSKKFNAREVEMEKQCTSLMFTFEVVAYEFQTHSLLCISTNASTRRFFNCPTFLPFKDAPGISLSVKIVRKGFLFDLLTYSQSSLHASFTAIVLNFPGVWLQLPECSAHVMSSCKINVLLACAIHVTKVSIASSHTRDIDWMHLQVNIWTWIT